MSSRVVSFGSCARREPPSEPVCDPTSPASASSNNMRRITTGFVFTLSATCSDLRGSSPDQAIKLKTCTATANLLFVDISNTIGNLGTLLFVTIIVTILILSNPNTERVYKIRYYVRAGETEGPLSS